MLKVHERVRFLKCVGSLPHLCPLLQEPVGLGMIQPIFYFASHAPSLSPLLFSCFVREDGGSNLCTRFLILLDTVELLLRMAEPILKLGKDKNRRFYVEACKSWGYHFKSSPRDLPVYNDGEFKSPAAL